MLGALTPSNILSSALVIACLLFYTKNNLLEREINTRAQREQELLEALTSAKTSEAHALLKIEEQNSAIVALEIESNAKSERAKSEIMELKRRFNALTLPKGRDCAQELAYYKSLFEVGNKEKEEQ